ncbi:MAG: NAD(P)/FAD-dependent oxidoreductase, partial [Ruminiclostridium sp.]|nr:NAD(P)/FAD-dependent oxidoreductase [Ruminiclostridium sp.]
IQNYPGFPDISGMELNEKLAEHMRRMDISFAEKRINGIYDIGGYFMLLAGENEYKADTVIIAAGARSVKELPGERELLGKGVSYCATCDGNFYKGKTIAVICDYKEAEEEVDFLAGLAEKVYFSPSYKTDFSRSNVVTLGSPVVSVKGEKHADAVSLKDGSEIAVDGVFFLRQSVSADILLNGLEMDNGSIAVGRDMSTSVKGCFAAGDCTGAPYQIAKAIGEGNTALHSAIRYLAGKKAQTE